MALFKKKSNTPDARQILLNEFPRTANSLSMRINLLTSGMSTQSLIIKERDDEIFSFNDSALKEIESIRQDLAELKTIINEINKHLKVTMELTGTKATITQLERLNKITEVYDFSEYLTKQQFVQLK